MLWTMNSTASTDYVADDTMALVYFYCTLVMSILSIVGASVIMLTYWYFDDMRSVGRKMLCFLSLADFLTAVGNILGITWYEVKDSRNVVECEATCFALCETHAVITIFSSNSSYIWTVAMALHLYVTIVVRKRLGYKNFAVFHIVCWGFPGKKHHILLSRFVVVHVQA